MRYARDFLAQLSSIDLYLNLCRCTTAAEAFKELSDLYEGRQRCGVAQFGAGLEAYLLPGCELSERILKTAIRAAPLDTRGTIPRAIGAAEMLLLFVHRRVSRPSQSTLPSTLWGASRGRLYYIYFRCPTCTPLLWFSPDPTH